MYRMEEWDDFLDALYLRAMKTLKTSQIFEYQQERQKQREALLGNILISADKPILEEIFVEMWADEEYRLRSLYQQGYKDCIAILKALAVFCWLQAHLRRFSPYPFGSAGKGLERETLLPFPRVRRFGTHSETGSKFLLLFSIKSKEEILCFAEKVPNWRMTDIV